MPDRPAKDSQINAAMRSEIDRSTDTSSTQAPLESISVRKPNSAFWDWVWASVFLVCIAASLVLVFG